MLCIGTTARDSIAMLDDLALITSSPEGLLLLYSLSLELVVHTLVVLCVAGTLPCVFYSTFFHDRRKLCDWSWISAHLHRERFRLVRGRATPLYLWHHRLGVQQFLHGDVCHPNCSPTTSALFHDPNRRAGTNHVLRQWPW